jgi:hypothetical protein
MGQGFVSQLQVARGAMRMFGLRCHFTQPQLQPLMLEVVMAITITTGRSVRSDVNSGVDKNLDTIDSLNECAGAGPKRLRRCVTNRGTTHAELHE